MVPGIMEIKECRNCPRNCGVNREQGEKGYCRETKAVFLARAALHFWEEPCISGDRGSGAVFFSGCNLRCVFCQNRPVAEGKAGMEVSPERLAEIYLELQEKGAHNINLITPSHYTEQISHSLDTARSQGLHVPVIYNTSSYEKPEMLRQLTGKIQIYLPDFKYWSNETAQKYSGADDYRHWAEKALEEMVSQTGAPLFDEDGMMQSGVIVRHLLLPGHLSEGKKIVHYLHHTYGNRIYISLMNQYTPMPGVPAELNRKVRPREYDALVNYALELGVEQGFIQEGETAKESYIPAFNYEGVEKKGHGTIQCFDVGV